MCPLGGRKNEKIQLLGSRGEESFYEAVPHAWHPGSAKHWPTGFLSAISLTPQKSWAARIPIFTWLKRKLKFGKLIIEVSMKGFGREPTYAWLKIPRCFRQNKSQPGRNQPVSTKKAKETCWGQRAGDHGDKQKTEGKEVGNLFWEQNYRRICLEKRR